MVLSRRFFNGTMIAAALAVAGLSSPASADTTVPFSAEAFKAAQAAGSPILIEIHADWCPTCRAQAPIVKDLLATPELKNVTVLIADFDTELALRKSLKVTNQSTLVVFRQGKEVTRSTGDTSREGLAALLKKAIS